MIGGGGYGTFYCTFVHIQAKLDQDNFLRMVRWIRWHGLPDTVLEIRDLSVWVQATYLSVTEAPHNTKYLGEGGGDNWVDLEY